MSGHFDDRLNNGDLRKLVNMLRYSSRFFVRAVITLLISAFQRQGLDHYDCLRWAHHVPVRGNISVPACNALSQLPPKQGVRRRTHRSEAPSRQEKEKEQEEEQEEQTEQEEQEEGGRGAT